MYRVAVEHADGAWMFVTPVRWLMFGLGVLLGFVGLGLLFGKSPDIDPQLKRYKTRPSDTRR